MMTTMRVYVFLSTLFFVSMTAQVGYAQSNRTLEEAQKKLEKAQKELEKAKREMEEASKGKSVKEREDSTTAGWAVPVARQKGVRTNLKSEKSEANEQMSNAKYLSGAVPVNAEGKVVFSLLLPVPDKSAKDIYEMAYKQLTLLTENENQFDESTIALVNPKTNIIAAKFKEWLVFSNNFLSLDRAVFYYTIIAHCADGELKLSLERISYEYETDRPSGFKSKAEDLITDKEALNKKGIKLNRLTGKFRRKTIDRKDQIFESFKELFKQ